MAKRKTYKHDTSRSIHETVSQLHEAGIVSPTTMRKMDALAERVRSRYAAPADEQIDALVERGRNSSREQQRSLGKKIK